MRRGGALTVSAPAGPAGGGNQYQPGRQMYAERVRAMLEGDPDAPSEDDEEFFLEISLPWAWSVYDKVVALAVGDPVHADVRITRNKRGGGGGWVGNDFFYTAYMGEAFSVNPMVNGRFPGPNKRAELRVQMTKSEFYRVQEYLASMVNRVKYNMADLPLLSPVVPKGAAGMTMIEEVEGFMDPENVRKVFCSQAVVLLLKACLPSKCPWMQGECSRTVSPCRLYHLVAEGLSASK